jgi:AraC-like DNA-binding protein
MPGGKMLFHGTPRAGESGGDDATMAPTVSESLYVEVGRAAVRMGYPLDDRSGDGRRLLSRRLPLAALVRLLDDLESLSGDPAIGLRVGRLLGPSAFGIPGYMAMAGPTLLESLPRVIGYQRLVADGVALRFAIDREAVGFHLEYADPTVPRTLSDLMMASVRCFGSWLLGTTPPLAAVSFRYGTPADMLLYEDIFGCQPTFGAGQDGFVLARAWLDLPLRTAEASLGPLLEAQAARLLAAFRGDNYVATVSQMIVDLLPVGEVGMSTVAEQLHASPRTLQRRLQAHGMTFNRLLQEVRMQLANRYLADAELSLQDIAGRLGYQEHSSFCHAYRQWTGRAPSAARRAAQWVQA